MPGCASCVLRPPRGLVLAASYVPTGETHKQQRLLVRRRLPWRGRWLCRWLRAPAGCALLSHALLVLLLLYLPLRLLRRKLVTPLCAARSRGTILEKNYG